MQVLDSPTTAPVTSQQPKLLDRLRAAVRVKHYSYSTEQSYVAWARRYILHHGKRHPADMGAPEVEAFLNHLATERRISASTQNQALAALLFLYRHVLGVDLPWLDNLTRAKRSQRVPTVLSQAEVTRLLRNVRGTEGTVIRLLYGTGMRIMEALRLRIMDVDFDRSEITVRNGKGAKDRRLMLPKTLREDLQRIKEERRRWHDRDLALGMAGANPMWVARQLGHANMAMTLRVYSRWIDGADHGRELGRVDAALGALGRNLGQNGGKQGNAGE